MSKPSSSFSRLDRQAGSKSTGLRLERGGDGLARLDHERVEHDARSSAADDTPCPDRRLGGDRRGAAITAAAMGLGDLDRGRRRKSVMFGCARCRNPAAADGCGVAGLDPSVESVRAVRRRPGSPRSRTPALAAKAGTSVSDAAGAEAGWSPIWAGAIQREALHRVVEVDLFTSTTPPEETSAPTST